MDTIFMHYENSKTSNPQKLLLNLSDKANLKRSGKYVALSNLNIYYTYKNIKNTKIINLKHQLPHGMKNLDYLMNQIINQIFKTILNIS